MKNILKGNGACFSLLYMKKEMKTQEERTPNHKKNRLEMSQEK
jgi:hypothetical protein